MITNSKLGKIYSNYITHVHRNGFVFVFVRFFSVRIYVQTKHAQCLHEIDVNRTQTDDVIQLAACCGPLTDLVLLLTV